MLQDLLDAQAEGLMAGLGNPVPEELTSNGSLTPTVSSMRSQTQSPTRPGARRKFGLRGARRALYRTMLDCAKLKEEENAVVQAELDRDGAILGQLHDWEDRRNGLEKEVARIEKQDTETTKQSLKEEASHLQSRIDDMELRLSRMKNRHRQLLEEIQELENSVQSQLSSYKSSLSLLESNIQDFLTRPPVRVTQEPSEESTFMSLPPKRRTLEMAKDYWSAHSSSLSSQQKAAARNRAALEEGAVVWRQVVEEVTAVEQFLREEMQKLATGTRRNSKGKAKSKSSPRNESPNPGSILERMDRAIAFVGSKLTLARSKNWNLLEVCIGAELEALRQGRNLLEDGFGLAEDDPLEKTLTDLSAPTAENASSYAGTVTSGSASGIEELGSHAAALHQKMYDTDDDGPDERIMFSRVKTNDTDNE